ncbi:MAG: hypothetical protein A3G34_17620 [Candidatus Lindowbacteria bacterium RIFCSPLOWO2_12_FULL_62_27]|nr:MAG: hypothetical protein A3G34_17620 [Candidatus Lindowbacteria bacterium RIFCSPLOWO2_12_FULL_62_27]
MDTVDGLRLSDTVTGLYNDTYYWRVRAIDDLGNIGAYADTRGFLLDTSVRNVTLLAPVHGLRTNDSTPLFTWAALADSVGIDSYAIELSRNVNFTSLILADTLDVSRTSDSAQNFLVEDTYYWRVLAIDELGNRLDVAPDSFRFIVDTSMAVSLVSPAAGHETTNARVTFLWSSLDAETYTWQLSKSAAFTTIIDSAVDTSAIQVRSDLPDQDTYFWRVIGSDAAGNFDTAAARTLVLDTSVYPVALAAPANSHETTTAAPIVSWQAVSDSVGIDSYVVEVSKTLAFTSTVFVDTADGAFTADTVLGLYNDTYFWRVRAIDDLGNVGPTSDTRGFIIDTAVEKVALVQPAAGHETTNATPVVTWQAVSDSVGVDSYVVEASNFLSFSVAIFADTLDAVAAGDTITGLYNDTYYWRVRAVDDLGNISMFSDTRGFVVDTDIDAVVAASPANAHETTNATPVVSWQTLSDSVGVDSYIVEVSKSAAFTAAVLIDTVDGTSASDTITGLYNDTYFWRVRAIDHLGHVGAYSDTFGFIVDTAVEKVVLLSPSQGTRTNDTTPTLTWQAITTDSVGIDSYAIEVSAGASFAVIARADTVDMAVTSYTIGPFLTEDTYYWRVHAIDDLGNRTDLAPDTFRLVIDTSLTVSLVAPADGHETTNVNVMFIWSTTDAETFTWQLSKSPAFSTTLDSVVDTAALQALRRLPEQDTFYWRVIGQDAAGNYDTTTFRIILLDTFVAQVSAIQPADAHETTNAMPVVTWQSVADSVGIDSYVVELSKLLTFAAADFVDTIDGTRTADTVTGLYNDTYFWRVRAIDELANIGAYSDTRGFLLDTDVARVLLLSPVDSLVTKDTTPTFTWQAIAADSVGVDSYSLEVTPSPSFAFVSYADTVDAAVTSDTLTILVEDTYYWRVQGIDDLGNRGPYSDSFDFRLDTGVRVVLTAPADDTFTTDTRPTFVWSSDGETFVILIAFDSAFTRVAETTQVVGVPSYRTPGLTDSVYYWRILAEDRAVNYDTSVIRRLYVDTGAPVEVSLASPAEGYTRNDTTPTMAWQASRDTVTGLNFYVVQVAALDDTSFTAPIRSDTQYDTEWDVTPFLTEGTYRWRVVAVDTAGVPTRASDSRALVIDTSLIVTLLTPADNHDTINRQPRFTWTSNDGGETFVLQIAGDTTFASVLQASTIVLDTTFVPATLADSFYYWRVLAIDTAGNFDTTVTRKFTVDTAPPILTIDGPEDGVDTIESTIRFFGTARDTLVGMDSVSIEVNGVIVDSVAILSADSRWAVDVSLNTAGIYVLRVFGHDRLSNFSQDTIRVLFEASLALGQGAHPPVDTEVDDDSSNVEWLQLALTAAGAPEPVRIDTMVFRYDTGSLGPDTEIEFVDLYLDGDSDGVLDASPTDTFVQRAALAGSIATFSNIGDTVRVPSLGRISVLVVANMDTTLVAGDTYALVLAANADVYAVGVVTGDTIRITGAPVRSISLKARPGRLFLTRSDTQPKRFTVQESDTNAVAVFNFAADRQEAVSVSQVKVTHTGSMPASAVTQVRLYMDADTIGSLGTRDTFLWSGTFSGSSATLSGTPFTVQAAETVPVLVAYVTAANLTINSMFYVEIASNSDVKVRGIDSLDDLNVLGAPVRSDTYTVRTRYPAVDTTHPTDGTYLLPPPFDTDNRLLPLIVTFNIPVDSSTVTETSVALVDAAGVSVTQSVTVLDSRTVQIQAVYADTAWPALRRFYLRVDTSVRDQDEPADYKQATTTTVFNTLISAEQLASIDSAASPDGKARLKLKPGLFKPGLGPVWMAVTDPDSTNKVVLEESKETAKNMPFMELLPAELGQSIYDFTIAKINLANPTVLTPLVPDDFAEPLGIELDVTQPTAFYEADGTPLTAHMLTLSHYNETTRLWESVSDASLNLYGETATIKGSSKNFSMYAVVFEFAAGQSAQETFRGFPNPASPFESYTEQGTTWSGFKFAWNMTKAGSATIRIYDFTGELVRVIGPVTYGAGVNLFNTLVQAPTWDGRNGQGRVVLNGGYFVRLTVEYTDGSSEVATDRIAVAK